jgi:hypothetical protein
MFADTMPFDQIMFCDYCETQQIHKPLLIKLQENPTKWGYLMACTGEH